MGFQGLDIRGSDELDESIVLGQDRPMERKNGTYPYLYHLPYHIIQ